MVHLCKKYLSLKLLITYNGLGNVTFPLNTKSPKSRFPPQKFYDIDHPEREKVDDAGHRISRRKLREFESDQVLGKLQSDQRVSADGVQAALDCAPNAEELPFPRLGGHSRRKFIWNFDQKLKQLVPPNLIGEKKETQTKSCN